MPRRRLRLQHYSSDDDEEEGEDEIGASGIGDSAQSIGRAPSIQPESSSASNLNPNPVEPEVEIIDVSGNPTPSPPDSSIPVDPSEAEVENGYDSPMAEALSRMGIKLKTEWWVTCLSGLEVSVPQFSRLEVAAKAKHCFEQFLFCDMNLCGGGVLPRNVASMVLEELPGPFVLQVVPFFGIEIMHKVCFFFTETCGLIVRLMRLLTLGVPSKGGMRTLMQGLRGV